MSNNHDRQPQFDRPPTNETLPPLDSVADAAIRRAMRWLNQAEIETEFAGSTNAPRGHGPPASTDSPAQPNSRIEYAATQLAKLVHDPAGVDFTMTFVDRVARPEDNKTAARQLSRLTTSSATPSFLSSLDRAAMKLGGILSQRIPGVVMPIARKRMRDLVNHLVLDSEGSALQELLDDAHSHGRQLNLNLLGEAVLGRDEAQRRLQDTIELLSRPNVDYVSVKASSVVSQLNPWDFDGSVDQLIETLRPLYRIAMSDRERQPFISLDMEEYRDLELTLAVFERLMSEEEFLPLHAGIVIQAYLPDSVAAVHRLVEFAQQRVTEGGAPLKVRLVKGANLSMETVVADAEGWERAPYATKAETDANYLRLLDLLLRPDIAPHLRVGVASHNLFSMATAVELAHARGVEDQIDAEMLQGMAPRQQQAIEAEVGRLILYTPVVDVRSFDVAVSYLVRRLEENAAEENFLHAMTSSDNDDAMHGQMRRYLAAIHDRNSTSTKPRRTQDRRYETTPGVVTTSQAKRAQSTTVFTNEPDTDPALPANREWARSIVDITSDPGPAVSPLIDDVVDVDDIVAKAVRLQPDWAARGGAGRADVLEVVGKRLASRRSDLLAAAIHGPGKTVAETDPEISEAIDFVRYYATSAREMDREPGVDFAPHRVTVVSPPWNFPIAIPIGGMTAALAAGSAVVIAPAPQVVRVAEVAVAALRDGLSDAGVDPDLIQLANTDEADAGRALLTHDDVDAVILTGASETAALFRGWKPSLPVFAETSGKNAMIVTPAADPDLAAADVVTSAFGHAGQKCSAGSLVILVGAAGKSDRLLNQILDATRTLQVGHGRDLSTDMGPLVEPPGEKLHRALTSLEKGEKWLVEPQQLNSDGTLWSPGVRDNVQPGSWFHMTECFGPVLGIMRAPDLDTAIEWQNAVEYGLTGGIHTLDSNEVAYWLDRVEVGNAYVNRHTTGAIVRRQAFGGWKGSSVGPGAKAGGPNYVAQQGSVTDSSEASDALAQATPTRRIGRVVRELQAVLGDDADYVTTATHSDAHALAVEFDRPRDESGLIGEANVFRYRALPDAVVRVAANAKVVTVTRTVLAAVAAGEVSSNAVTVTVAPDVDDVVTDALEIIVRHGLAEVVVESDTAFVQRIRESVSSRIRCCGTVSDEALSIAAENGSWLERAGVVQSGRFEMLHYLREQSISWSMHRFGHISADTDSAVTEALNLSR
ncbi:bifunctional proline dehydrogenase/L-glutamate gamma-semialdehyde dehydrogenase [Corynebacterium sp. H78]|uniref:bifunctional proline dehydrogenase/L-glutamate gamma-semialdehyde dehydrogenase n=1 Tax=Corynebacterium sp. H78 TaxID=3133417 RepID=UPI00309B45C1